MICGLLGISRRSSGEAFLKDQMEDGLKIQSVVVEEMFAYTVDLGEHLMERLRGWE